MRVVEIGCWLIHQQSNAPMPLCSHLIALREYESRAQQFLLTSGRSPTGMCGVELDLQIGSVRADTRVAYGPVRSTAVTKGCHQVLRLCPAAPVTECDAVAKKLPGKATECRLQFPKILAPTLVHTGGRSGQFQVPGLDVRFCNTLTQGQVALQKRPAESSPKLQVLVFHVEHTPIQEAAAGLGRSRDEVADLRVNSLQG